MYTPGIPPTFTTPAVGSMLGGMDPVRHVAASRVATTAGPYVSNVGVPSNAYLGSNNAFVSNVGVPVATHAHLAAPHTHTTLHGSTIGMAVGVSAVGPAMRGSLIGANIISDKTIGPSDTVVPVGPAVLVSSVFTPLPKTTVEVPVAVPVQVPVAVEKQVFVERPVDRTVYVDRPVEKTVYVDRPVERQVFVDRPVEKTVYVDRPVERTVEKQVFVDRPVEKTVYVDRPV